MNRFISIGRATLDPETRYTENGTTFSRFSIAIERKYKKEGDPNADFFSVTAFGRTAEVIEKYVRKGMKVAITGRIENNNFTNAKGEKVYAVNIIAEEIEFCESKSHNEKASVNSTDGVQEEIPFK